MLENFKINKKKIINIIKSFINSLVNSNKKRKINKKIKKS